MRLMRVDTGYRHALGDRYKYHLLILWRQLVRLAAIAGKCFGSISKVFSALIIGLPRVSPGHPVASVSCRVAKTQEESKRHGKRSNGMRLTCPSHRN